MGNSKMAAENVTITLIFDGSALNRDEKIGGNILSIKKLTFKDEERPFISKNAIRHYLFTTLMQAFNWEETPILKQGDGNKQTLQLDLTKSNILNSNELALFGYMFTKANESALTRKSPLGITKAIGLFPYKQDMAFYANHDFVNRVNKQGKNATPNPLNKEEYNGLFKLSFTIDKKMLAQDVWIVDEFSYSENQLKVEIAKPQTFVIRNVEKKYDDNDEFIGYITKEEENSPSEFEIKINDFTVELPKNMVNISKNVLSIKPVFAFDRKKNNKDKYTTKFSFKVIEYEENGESAKEKSYSFECTYEPLYDEKGKTLTLKSGHESIIDGFKCDNYNKQNKVNKFTNNNNDVIEITSLADSNFEKGPFELRFKLSENKANNIIKNLLDSIHNGLTAHSSGELNTIVPLFLIAGKVKVPSPVFHSYIDVRSKNNGTYEVFGINDALKNRWLEDSVYIFDSERLKRQPLLNKDKNIEENWDNFLNFLNNNDDNNNS